MVQIQRGEWELHYICKLLFNPTAMRVVENIEMDGQIGCASRASTTIMVDFLIGEFVVIACQKHKNSS